MIPQASLHLGLLAVHRLILGKLVERRTLVVETRTIAVELVASSEERTVVVAAVAVAGRTRARPRGGAGGGKASRRVTAFSLRAAFASAPARSSAASTRVCPTCAATMSVVTHERGHAVVVRARNVGARAEQHVGRVAVACLRGDVQARPAVARGRVRVRARREQRAQSVGVPALRSDEELRRAVRTRATRTARRSRATTARA